MDDSLFYFSRYGHYVLVHFVFLFQSTRSMKNFRRECNGNVYGRHYCFPVGHALLYWVKLDVDHLLLCGLHFEKE